MPPNAPDSRTLDLPDRKILSALRADARLTMSQLAERVGLSASPCWTRVKRLEALGVIERYAAIIDLWGQEWTRYCMTPTPSGDSPVPAHAQRGVSVKLAVRLSPGARRAPPSG